MTGRSAAAQLAGRDETASLSLIPSQASPTRTSPAVERPELRVVPQLPEWGAVAPTDDWTAKAVCSRHDPDLLFVTGAAQRDAARLCHGCPVKLECLADALDNQVEFGVWGGLTERQRRAILRRNPDVTSWLDVLSQARDEATNPATGS